MREDHVWTYLDIKIVNYEAFKDVYGFVAGNEVLRFMALLVGEVLDELGTPNDFVGHAGSDNFVMITYSEKADQLIKRLGDRFADEVQQHYSFIDRERGFMMKDGEKVPLMTLAVGSISNATRQFADIREITELAAESRRRGTTEDEGPIATEW
jgi:GGDEF domain-containing protein